MNEKGKLQYVRSCLAECCWITLNKFKFHIQNILLSWKEKWQEIQCGWSFLNMLVPMIHVLLCSISKPWCSIVPNDSDLIHILKNEAVSIVFTVLQLILHTLKNECSKIFTDSGDVWYQDVFWLSFESDRLIRTANDCSRIQCDIRITFIQVRRRYIYWNSFREVKRWMDSGHRILATYGIPYKRCSYSEVDFIGHPIAYILVYERIINAELFDVSVMNLK